jgi:RNase P/RNase MRP subunit p29
MSTAPQGWQNPKTNWQAADVVNPSDFNRIEGNIQAIESGSRTLDPSQAPSGNSGPLRQVLDWFANRLKVITGAANWYDAPATTLAATKSHIDATSGIHGATSSATANRIIIRDSAGRAKVAAPSASDDIARKAEVDAVSSTLNTHIAATSGIHGATSSATANRLIIRDSNGRASVANPTSASHIATKNYVDNLVGPLQAGTAFAYHLTPPNVELSYGNVEYNNWWFHDITRSVVVQILRSGTIRYHVQYRADIPTRTTYVRILRNGSRIREVSITDSVSWQTATDNITVSPGDIITIQKRVSHSAGVAHWRNVRIETAQPTLGIQCFF